MDEIQTALGGETADFVVKADKAMPFSASIPYLFFSFFWLAITGIMIAAFIGPVLFGNNVHFTANGVAAVAGPGNLAPLIFPAVFLGFFLIIGLSILCFALYCLIAPGAWFAGTPTRLVMKKRKTLRTIGWEQFTGDVVVKGDNEKGSITLMLQSGRMVSRRHGSSRYVPSTIYISGIRNAIGISEMIRNRIGRSSAPAAYPDEIRN